MAHEDEHSRRMQSQLDTYHLKSSTRSLPDIAEVPGQEEHDDTSCRCHALKKHARPQKCTSSREPKKTSLVLQRHNKAHDANHIRTHAKGAAYKTILTFAAVGVVFVFSTMACMLVSLGYTQTQLLERVTSLEHKLTEFDIACECGRSPEGGKEHGEKRHNKFAFLMTHGHVKLLEGEKEMKTEEEFGLNDEIKETHETEAPEVHPKILIKLEEARSTVASLQVQDHENRDSALLDAKRASQEWMPDTSKIIRGAGRVIRNTRKRGKDHRRQSEDMQRARASPRTERNSTEIRGVHFQANLNRTTTIGVGEDRPGAGWVPYWTVSSSLLKIGSPELTNEIKTEFRLSARGNVTVRTGGLYYVYSQMMYYDPNEYIGHSIVVDGVEAFTCIAPITGQTNKYKTCFIGGLVYIPTRGKVGIKMLYTPRRVCLFEDTSYFGMFRVT